MAIQSCFSVRAFMIPALLASVLTATPTYANDSTDLGWSSSGRISLVHNEGNGDFTAAGVDLSFHYQWEEAGFDLNLGTVLAQNETLTREAVGTPEDFTVQEITEEETIAESWSISFNYQQKFSRHFMWVTHGGWERDEPGGFENRYSAGFGLGVITDESRKSCLATVLSLTWNRQENLVAPEGTDPEFPGFRWVFGYNRPVNTHTDFESSLSLYGNFDDLDDYRTEWSNALTVSINDWLALEIEAQWKHGSKPPLQRIPLNSPNGQNIQFAFAELDENETHLAIAFVFQR